MAHAAIILSTLLSLLFIPSLNTYHRETKMLKAFSITRLARDNLQLNILYDSYYS